MTHYPLLLCVGIILCWWNSWSLKARTEWPESTWWYVCVWDVHMHFSIHLKLWVSVPSDY